MITCAFLSQYRGDRGRFISAEVAIAAGFELAGISEELIKAFAAWIEQTSTRVWDRAIAGWRGMISAPYRERDRFETRIRAAESAHRWHDTPAPAFSSRPSAEKMRAAKRSLLLGLARS